MTAPARWLSEADIADLLDLPTAITAISDAFEQQHAEQAIDMAKTHVRWGHNTLHALGAAMEGFDVVGTKTWAHTSGGAEPLLLLWSATTGRLLAVIEAFALGQLRTAAVSGLATRLLATPEAHTLAMIGTGRQALGQAAAVLAVRPITQVRVFSPTEGHRRDFADQLAAAVSHVKVQAVDTIAEAIANANVVTTATRATSPFLDDVARMAPSVLINAVGAITPERAELGPALVRAAGRIVTDSVGAARRLASELDVLAESDWDDVVALCDVVGTGPPATSPGGATVFKAMGAGLADVGLGLRALRAAVELDRGRPLAPRERAQPRLFTTSDTAATGRHSHVR